MSATFIFVLFVASAQLVLSSNPSPIIVRHVSSPRKVSFAIRNQIAKYFLLSGSNSILSKISR